jgi:hypothetical protein
MVKEEEREREALHGAKKSQNTSSPTHLLRREARVAGSCAVKNETRVLWRSPLSRLFGKHPLHSSPQASHESSLLLIFPFSLSHNLFHYIYSFNLSW